MLTITGHRLLDVLIVFVVVFVLTEIVIWIIKKYFIKDDTKPVGGVYEGNNNQSNK